MPAAALRPPAIPKILLAQPLERSVRTTAEAYPSPESSPQLMKSPPAAISAVKNKDLRKAASSRPDIPTPRCPTSPARSVNVGMEQQRLPASTARQESPAERIVSRVEGRRRARRSVRPGRTDHLHHDAFRLRAPAAQSFPALRIMASVPSIASTANHGSPGNHDGLAERERQVTEHIAAVLDIGGLFLGEFLRNMPFRGKVIGQIRSVGAHAQPALSKAAIFFRAAVVSLLPLREAHGARGRAATRNQIRLGPFRQASRNGRRDGAYRVSSHSGRVHDSGPVRFHCTKATERRPLRPTPRTETGRPDSRR
jgi:hypothetical protein